MAMRKAIHDPLLAEERAEIYAQWKAGDQAAYKWIGRLIREIEHLHKQAEERSNLFFLANGVEVERLTPAKAAELYDAKVAQREARLARV